MSNFNIGLQEAKGGYRVVLYSRDNGKLVLAGEVIKNMQGALATLKSIAEAWNDKRDTLTIPQWSTGSTGGVTVIPKGHKWPGNAGPKKKAVKKTPAKKTKKK